MAGLCPHLGLRHDPASACLYPTRDHVCAAGHASPIPGDHQRTFCLADYPRCATYSRADLSDAAPEEPPADALAIDPHKVLQLHPRAPYELIEEAYNALVHRARQQGGGEAASEARIRQLNEAYRLLSSHDAASRDRGGSQQERPRSRARRPGRPDLYELLAVDESAGTEIIEIAFAIARRAPGTTADDVLLLEQARRTLADPGLRERYDEGRAEPGAGVVRRRRATGERRAADPSRRFDA